MRRTTCAALLFLLVSGAGLLAAAPDFLRVTPLPRDGHVYVSFQLAGAFSDEIRETIRSGLPTTFLYDFELRRQVPVWVDRTIAVTTVQASVQFDNLTRRYQLSRSLDGRVDDAVVTDDEEEVERWMTTFERLPLFSTTGLEENSEYYVRVRARARPRSTWTMLPWDRSGAWGSARFTFLR